MNYTNATGKRWNPFRLKLLVAAFAALPLITFATDYYVDPNNGSDSNNALAAVSTSDGNGPVKRVQQIIKQAKGGDTIHVIPGKEPYRICLDLYGSPGGTPGDPLIVDGQGSTLSGAEQLDSAGWKPWKSGIFMRDDIHLADISRAFLVVNGQMSFPLFACDALEPGEFCYEGDVLFFLPPAGTRAKDWNVAVQSEGQTQVLDSTKFEKSHSNIGSLRYKGLKSVETVTFNGATAPLVTAKERIKPGMWCKEREVIYLFPCDKEPLGKLDVQAPVRDNGVQVGGNTSHVVIRHFNVRHVNNDAYNIHGSCKDILFQDCNAWQCGDEGISAHGSCDVAVDGALLEQCDVGITHIQTVTSVTQNVVIANCRENGFGVIASTLTPGHHELKNLTIINTPTALNISGGPVSVENVLIWNSAEGRVRQSEWSKVQPEHRKSNTPDTVINVTGGNLAISNATVCGESKMFVRCSGIDAAIQMKKSVVGPGMPSILVRSDIPQSMFIVENSVLSDDLAMQWGKTPPWKGQAIGQWINDTNKNCTVEKMSAADSWLKQPPAFADGMGCSGALWSVLQHWYKK